jgi:hypothetical protein
MANYLFIYHGGAMGDSEEEKQKIANDWNLWMKQCGDNLVDAGNPCSNAMSVSKDGSRDYSGSERVTGYTVLKASSMEDAVKAATMVPLVVDGSGSVDVYETFDPMQ